jgi:hypothetical protein
MRDIREKWLEVYLRKEREEFVQGVEKFYQKG